MSKPEAKVVKAIFKALDLNYPGFYFKSHGGPYQVAGLPDIIGLHRGRFIGIEVKAPGKEKTLTEKQKLVINHINAAGGIAFMATSAEQVIEHLKLTLGGEKHVKGKSKKTQ